MDKLCDEYGIEKENENEYEHPLMQSEETYKVSNVLTGNFGGLMWPPKSVGVNLYVGA